MPLYEYRCLKCGHHIEVLQKINDRPLRRCGECSGKVEKLISRTSFQLKGGGWFDQGYGSKSAGKASPSAGKTSSSGEKETKKKSSTDADSSGSKKSSATSA